MLAHLESNDNQSDVGLTLTLERSKSTKKKLPLQLFEIKENVRDAEIGNTPHTKNLPIPAPTQKSINLPEEDLITHSPSWDISRGSSLKTTDFRPLNSQPHMNPTEGKINTDEMLLGNKDDLQEKSKFRSRQKRKTKRVATNLFNRLLKGEKRRLTKEFKPNFDVKQALVLSVSKFGFKKGDRNNGFSKNLKSQREKSREMSDRLINSFNTEITKLQENMNKSYFLGYDNLFSQKSKKKLEEIQS